MSFCTHCGTELVPGNAFCIKCGAVASAAGEPPPSVPVNPAPQLTLHATTPPPEPAPQPAKKNGCLPLVLVVVAVLVLALAAGAAALIYAGYKAKQKASAFLHSATSSAPLPGTAPTGSATNATPAPGSTAATAQQSDGVDKGLDAIGALADRMGFGGPPADPYADLEVVKMADIPNIQCPSADTVTPADIVKPTSARIPMREGLIVTTTWGRRLGDVDESMSTSTIKPEAMTLTNSGLSFDDDNDAKGKLTTRMRILCAGDLKTAHGYSTGTYEHSPQVSPGVTSEILSAAAFQQLKQTGKLTLRFMNYITAPDGYYKHWQDGELKRVEPNDLPYSVIVNDTLTTLPAIHAQGILTPEGKAANKDSKYAIDRPTMLDLKVSDDPLNPIVLFFKFEGDPFRMEVTRIEFPNQEKKIEQELQKEKKAVVYGIYFDFNSDKIKPESKQVLDDIAAALKDNPDWKLTVDGHTDNIGGDAYNLDLSRRRSAAVKQALVTQYHIAPDRLSSTGSGVAGAIDTNDTVLGRSHNRRVELTRQ